MQAAIKTALFISTMLVGAFAMSALLTYLDPSARDVMYAIMAVCFAGWVYIAYSFNVSQAEYKAKLEEMTKK